jgi:hypothetical protein
METSMTRLANVLRLLWAAVTEARDQLSAVGRYGIGLLLVVTMNRRGAESATESRCEFGLEHRPSIECARSAPRFGVLLACWLRRGVRTGRGCWLGRCGSCCSG